jgi:hypothetical protein
MADTSQANRGYAAPLPRQQSNLGASDNLLKMARQRAMQTVFESRHDYWKNPDIFSADVARC